MVAHRNLLLLRIAVLRKSATRAVLFGGTEIAALADETLRGVVDMDGTRLDIITRLFHGDKGSFGKYNRFSPDKKQPLFT